MTFISALILGLVASVHCAGMCGGLQAAFQGDRPMRTKHQALLHLLVLNTGRITTYLAGGVTVALFGIGLVSSLNLPVASRWMRAAAGVVILLIGVQLLFKSQRPFHFFERFGEALWHRANAFIKLDSDLLRQSYFNGVLWGLLPCGLIYSVVLAAAFAETLTITVLILLGFGMGTLPSMLLTGMAFKKFRDVMNAQSVRVAGAAFFIVGGTLILSAPWWVKKSFLRNYPELLNLVFCVT